MEKGIFAAYMIVLLSLLFAGCTQAPAPQETIKYVCPDGLTTVTDVAACPPSAPAAKELSEQEKALEVCTDMPLYQGASLEDVCIMGLAGKYKDIALCKEAGRDQRLNCYTLVAELKDNPAICEEATSMVEQCYQQYASDKKDSSVCSIIKDISSRDSCYDRVANQVFEPSICGKITNINQKDSCYFNMAMRIGSSEYCESITNSDQKQNCLSNMQNRGGGYAVPIEKKQ